ncbi:hypothetical protein OAT67_00835 [Bacteriovoracaceae bacterium]|nr:hypothetical protein [Bacteriovoracaceae bacterium]
MLKTLFISLGLLFLSSCNSGGDGGGAPAPASSVTSTTTGDNTGADDFQLSEKDLEKIEDDFQKINKTIVSENFKATIKKVSQDFVGFDLRKTGIYNLDNIPTNYVLSYHRNKGKRINNLFDLYKVKNYGEIVESYTPTESLSNTKIGKFKKILHSSENTFVITQRPIQLLRLSTATNEIELVSSFPVKERRIHYLSSNNEGLCVISRIEDSFVAYHYQFSNQIFKETAFDHQLKNAKFAGSFHCDSEKMVLVKRENKKYQLFKKGFDNSPLEELSLSRDPNVTYSFYKSNAKTILSLKDTSGRSYFDLSEASAAPLAERPVRDSNPFRKTKIAIVKNRPSIDNPIVTLVYSNEKTIDIQMSYYKARIVDLKKIKNTLVAIVEGNFPS